MDTVILRKVECLECKHLIPRLEVEHSCTDDPYCPSKYLTIAIGVNVQRAASELAEAHASGDPSALSQMYGRLSKLDAPVQALIQEELRKKQTADLQ